MANELVVVPFHGDEIQAVERDGHVWAVLKGMCESLKMDFNGQLQRLRRQRWATMCMMHTVAGDSKSREVVALRCDKIPMWLATVDLGRVKDKTVREKIERYQDEAARFLAEHFTRRSSTQPAHTQTLDDDPIINNLLQWQANTAAIIECRRRQMEIERAQAETVRMCAEALRVSAAACGTATAAMHQSTSNHGHFTVLGFARLRGWEMPVVRASSHGKKLSALCAARGITVGHMTDPRFGEVNTYPESLMNEYFATATP